MCNKASAWTSLRWVPGVHPEAATSEGCRDLLDPKHLQWRPQVELGLLRQQQRLPQGRGGFASPQPAMA